MLLSESSFFVCVLTFLSGSTLKNSKGNRFLSNMLEESGGCFQRAEALMGGVSLLLLA